MAKAKTRQTPAAPAPEASAEVSEVAPQTSPAEAVASLGFRTTKWADQDNFECERCDYATLDLERIQRHVAAQHA